MVDWISLSQTAGTSGTTTITITASSNTELVDRVTSLTVTAANKQGVVNIFQEKYHPLSISPESLYFSGRGSRHNLDISTDSDWQLTGPSWLSFSRTSGTGNYTVTVTADANASESAREGTIVATNTVVSASAYVYQTVSADSESVFITPSAFTITSAGEVTWLTITTDYPWNLTLPDWMGASVTSGVGTTNLYVWASENYNGKRKGVIWVETETEYAACVVTQTGVPVDLSTPLSYRFREDGYIEYDTYSMGPGSREIEYSRDFGATWTKLDIGEGKKTVYAGEVIQFRGNHDSYHYTTIGCTAKIDIYGNIMSMIDAQNYATLTAFTESHVFLSFFSGYHVVDASNLLLPAQYLTPYCYNNMFANCNYLTAAPELPATFYLAERCYYGMFTNCSRLKIAPDLPAQRVRDNCYERMFESTYYPESSHGLEYINCDARSYDDDGTKYPWLHTTAGWARSWGNWSSKGVFVGNSNFPWMEFGYKFGDESDAVSNGTSSIPRGWKFIDTKTA